MYLFEKNTSKTGSGYEQLEKCVTENGARSLQHAASSDVFPFLQAEMAGSDWQSIVAREYCYHQSCYKKLVKKRDPKATESSDIDKIFEELSAIIHAKLINDCEVLRMSDVSRLYLETKVRLFGDVLETTLPSTQKLKEKLQKTFGSKIGFWLPSCGSELVFNDVVAKGQLVEVAVRAKLANQNWEDKKIEEKITEVAREIRKELLLTPNTYKRYFGMQREKRRCFKFDTFFATSVSILTLLKQRRVTVDTL